MSTTGTPEDRATRVDDPYEEHRCADFPNRFRDDEPAGVDLALLDADLSGIVATWLHAGGRMDLTQRAVLGACPADLDRVLPELTDRLERRYVERIRDLARLLV